jgi:hypothetical protein
MITAPSPEQIAKLPKWAQEHIRHLEMIVRERGQHIADMNGQNEGTDTFVDNFGDASRRFNLPKGERITFALGPEHWNAIDVHLDRHLGQQFLQIRGRDTRIAVEPTSNNAILITIPRSR